MTGQYTDLMKLLRDAAQYSVTAGESVRLYEDPSSRDLRVVSDSGRVWTIERMVATRSVAAIEDPGLSQILAKALTTPDGRAMLIESAVAQAKSQKGDPPKQESFWDIVGDEEFELN